MSHLQVKQPRAPLENIVATYPLELVHLNYLCLDPGKGKEENVLMVMDHFTLTPRSLWDNFIVHCGFPKKILSDQGRNFESELIADLCRLRGHNNCELVYTILRPMANVKG